MAEKDIGITIKKEEDINEWYSQVVTKGDIADFSPVKGCMILKPNGYKIWEIIMDYFNSVLEKYNVKNAYFPMFIPESFFKKEAEHAEGFNPEVAWIEKKDENEERLAIRPTSETIIYDAYSKWIRSWRDLPLKINQWCNIVRWETKSVKLLLRSREFLWQEGHCAYSNKDDCLKETLLILDEYEKLCKTLLAIPCIKGEKTEKEKFAGAVNTFAIETLMPDGKALQLATSHFLGQKFAKAFNIMFLDKDSKKKYVWQNSWGFSTRLIGASIMLHSDNKGLILPPKIAPIQIIIIPIYTVNNKEKVIKEAIRIKEILNNFRTEIDLRDNYTPGWKFNEWELKGVPIRIEIGERDIKDHSVIIARRDDLSKRKIKITNLKHEIQSLFNDIHNALYEKAKKFLDEHIKKCNNINELKEEVNNRNLCLAPFCGRTECENSLKEKIPGISSRVIPFNQKSINEKCINCGEKAGFYVIFGKSY